MKKIITIVLALVVIATLATVVFAENTADPVDNGSSEPITDETTDTKVDVLLSAVGSGTFWTTAASILATLAGCIALFYNRFTKLTSSIEKTATTANLTKSVGTLAEEIKTALGEKTGQISANITAMLDNYKLLLTCFTIFIESAKINPNAKKEILDRLTGVKSVSDDVAATVMDALKAIEEANAAEPPLETPKTDAALAPMILG